MNPCPMPRPTGRPSETFPLGIRRLKVPEWPAADRAAREAALYIGAPLSPAGAAVRWAPATLAKRWGEWGRFLSYLASVGDLVEDETPATRLTEPRLARYIVSLRARVRASTTYSNVSDLSRAVAALAPDRDWSWVRRHPALPRVAEVRASRKPINPPDAAALLACLLSECDRADALPPAPENSIAFRNGVLMSIAVCTGLRRRNLAEMRIGEHVLVGRDHIRLLFTDSVKNGVVVDVLLPSFLLPNLRTYLGRHRPILLQGGDDTGDLWINLQGRPLQYSTLLNVFSQTGKRLFGRSLHVHLVRHAMATGIMERDPRDLEVAAAALTHKSTSSVDEVYDRSGAHTAQKMWMALRRKTLRDAQRRDDDRGPPD